MRKAKKLFRLFDWGIPTATLFWGLYLTLIHRGNYSQNEILLIMLAAAFGFLVAWFNPVKKAEVKIGKVKLNRSAN